MNGDAQRLKRTRLRRTVWGASFALIAAVAIVLVFALPGAAPRKHPDRIPVRFWHMWTAEWNDVVDKICERFNESQDVYEVIPLSVPMDSGETKLVLSVTGGNPPDAMTLWSGISKWADAGVLLPLNSLMTDAEWAEFKRTTYPAAQQIGIYEGNLYGVTTGLNTWACYVRMDHLREAGLDIKDFPQTLEGLFEWSDRLNRFDAQGNLTRVGYLPFWFYMYVTAFGGGFYNWETGELTLNTPENLRTIQFLVNERKKLGFDNVIRFQAGLAQGIGNAEWPFISGSYSIAMDGQWRVEQLARYAPDLEYVTRPIPPPAGGNPLYCWVNGNFIVIPKGSKCPKGAWEFIKFWSGLANPERAAEFYTWGGWLPLNPAVAYAPLYREYVRQHPQFQTFLDVLPSKYAQPTPPVPYQNYLWDRVVKLDEAAMRGSLTPEQTLETLAADVAREQASRREFGYKK